MKGVCTMLNYANSRTAVEDSALSLITAKRTTVDSGPSIIKGLKSDDVIINSKDIIVLNLGVVVNELNLTDSDLDNLDLRCMDVISNLRFYVRLADHLNDYENILINHMDYIRFEQTLFGMGFVIDSSSFLGDTVSSSVDGNSNSYKIRTNGSSILRISNDEVTIELIVTSMLFNSGNRVYRFEAVISSKQPA